MSKTTNWAEMDKRIRARRHDWTGEELKALDAALLKLPDLAEAIEYVMLPQPAVGATHASAEASGISNDDAVESGSSDSAGAS